MRFLLALLSARMVSSAVSNCSVSCGAPDPGCYPANLCDNAITVPDGQSCTAPSW
jgi:hypothetical protein